MDFLDILHRHSPDIVRRLNYLILPTSNPTSPSLRPHPDVRLEALRRDRIHVQRVEVDAELTIRMNGHNDDAAPVPCGSESVVGGFFVPCAVDQHVDLSKALEDFKVIETAVGLRPECGSGRTVQYVP